VDERWFVVIGVGLTAIALKASGPVLLGGRGLPARSREAIGLLPVAILSALVVSQTLVTGRSIAIDARVVGVLVALALVVLRAPIALVVIASAGATAIVRALGWNG
jgi:branched-subunit amino acid transport protein